MKRVYRCCCGLDVHKKVIVACLLRAEGTKEVKRYSATSPGLAEMAEWLLEADCEKVAMESTGVYWKPVFNVLEDKGLEAIVVNAQHMKAVPGRKTDVKDSEWIADLLMHGLLKASFIPERGQRELRDATRYRKRKVEERSREMARLDKVLEGANIKVSSVLASVSGQTGKAIIKALATGEVTDENIDVLLFGSTKQKRDALLVAVDGVLSDVQKALVLEMLDSIEDLTRRIDRLDAIIARELKDYQRAIDRLVEVPGFGASSAQTVLAETGLDMGRFPTAGHFASWAGLSPGNNESAGKRKRAKINRGNATLKSTLVQCAASAVRVKSSYFAAQYNRLVKRCGKKRALVAVAHSLLIAIYHMLKDDVAYKELGSDYYSRFNTEKKVNYHLRKLKELGYELKAHSAQTQVA